VKLLGQLPMKTLVKQDPRRDFVGGAEVVTVFSTERLLDVIQVLFKFKIGSVPVVTQSDQTEEKQTAVFDFWIDQGPKKEGVFLGFVDMVDILAYLVAALPENQEHKKEALDLAGRSLLESPIVNVINFGRKDKAVPISQSHPVAEALQYFGKGTHRVLLFNEHKILSGLSSQSDLIRLLHHRFEKGELQSVNFKFDKSILVRATVQSILPTDSVLQAIGKLGSGSLGTVAIVDAHGSLVGQFSASEVGYAFAVGKREESDISKEEILRTMFGHLDLPVRDYLAKFHPQSLKPEIIIPDISLQQVCKLMTEGNSKQLWVTNDATSKVPIGVLTQTDVCRRLAEVCL